MALSDAFLASVMARFFAFLFLVALSVYIGYASYYGVGDSLQPYVAEQSIRRYGGLNTCFQCPNGWNWHSLLMSLGFLFAFQEALFSFYYPKLKSHKSKLACHMVFLLLALGLIIPGFIAIVQYKQYMEPQLPQFYSAHSWVGIVVLAFFFLHMLVSPLMFFKSSLGETVVFVHRSTGKVIFFGGLLAMGMGLVGQQSILVLLYLIPRMWSSTYLLSLCALLLLFVATFAYFALDAGNRDAPVAEQGHVAPSQQPLKSEEAPMVPAPAEPVATLV